MPINYGNVIQLWADRQSETLDFAGEYGERGYTQPEKQVVLANWNNVPKRIADGLERQGYSLEWCDEWAIVRDKAYRTSANSYHWQSLILATEEGDYLTPDDSVADWIAACEQTCNGQPQRALPARITREEIEAEGWTKHNGTYENGWHPGQTDNPEAIALELLKTHDAVVFHIPELSQFYLKFEVYTRSA